MNSHHSPPPAEQPPWLSELREHIGHERVSQQGEDLDTYSRDLWPRFLLGVGAGEPPDSRPAAVVWPQSAAQVQTILRLCAKHHVALVPYGAGSGVAGGAVGPNGSLVLDTKRMRSVEIDAERGVVTFQPGILGWHLEEELNRRGLSLGHFPSSIMCSTAGGWLATRGAGQMSTKYGKIEDLVRSLELCTGAGERLLFDNGDHGGADWVQLAVGSEGTLGVITRATCAVRPLPEARRLRGFSFPNVESACEAIKQLLQQGLRPAVVRLYDELDTLISGMGRGRHGAARHDEALKDGMHDAPQTLGAAIARGLARGGLDFEELLTLFRSDAKRVRGRVERWLLKTVLGETEPVSRIIEGLLERLSPNTLLVLGFEGEANIVAAEDAYAREQVACCGGRDLGEEPGQHWLRHRYDVSFKMSRAFIAGAFADTIEVATTWDRILPLYREVRAAVAPYALCMAHFSHAYTDGCSIYFSVLGRRGASKSLPEAENRAAVAEDRQRYDALWQAAMQAALRVGATISHHHGVGRLKAPFMKSEHGDSLRILTALRIASDPQVICNPGNLAPRVPAARTSSPAPEAFSAPTLRVDSANMLLEAPCELRLYELERTLRQQGLSLGGLPPSAWGRTLYEALSRPRPSEASLESGRLRDRRALLTARLRDGSLLRVPPQVVPRRATGPDLGQVFLGQEGEVGEPLAATLRLWPHPAESLWAGFLYEEPEAAAHALFAARALHGSVAVAELVLMGRELVEHVLGKDAVGAAGQWALLLRAGGPEPVAKAVLHEVTARIGQKACGKVSAQACKDLWTPDTLFSATATEKSVAAAAAPFPVHERALSLAESSPTEVAATLRRAGGGSLLCGVYLHGMTLCQVQPLAEKPTAAAADTFAQTVLWPRLVAALRSS